MGGEEVCDKTINSFSFGEHGPAFSRGNQCRSFFKLRFFYRGQPVITQAKSLDQSAMDDEICITANWRCEMRIFVQIQTEMADIVRAVDSLTLRAKHNLID